MADKAISDSPLVQAQLDRLDTVSAKKDLLGHERLRNLLERLGNPQDRLPPVFHVAGTNGKGSTIAYMFEAIRTQGLKAHVFTSPHLVRLNERFRIANTLVTDKELAQLLSDVLDAVGENETTFFETITSAALLAFSRHDADACILEVGLGGRLDATNIVSEPAVCGITQIGLDHQEFLGHSIEEIAAEKAAVAKRGVPLLTMEYPPSVSTRIAEIAAEKGAPVLSRGQAWTARIESGRLHYTDADGSLDLPMPCLVGAHQAGNAGLAIAMLRHQADVPVPEYALSRAMEHARWPARLQHLGTGPLTRLAPEGAEVWLDGAHNVPAMEVVIDHMRTKLAEGETLHLVMGLLQRKDAAGLFATLQQLDCQIHSVPIKGHDARTPQELAAIAREQNIPAQSYDSVGDALRAIKDKNARILIVGSLYLAGHVLALNEEIPD
ncbi:MAG: bifunctional folylpolyglutamate synthase/dihydrofolate synthase [Sphingomonadaceae bacterium]